MAGTPHLKLFDDAGAAISVAKTSKAGDDLQVLRLGAAWYLKKPGASRIEPRFLCTDGHWRRYNLIPELPGSDAGRKSHCGDSAPPSAGQ